MTRKFDAVFVMDTLVVDGPAVKARVNNAHIITLQMTFKPRQA